MENHNVLENPFWKVRVQPFLMKMKLKHLLSTFYNNYYFATDFF